MGIKTMPAFIPKKNFLLGKVILVHGTGNQFFQGKGMEEYPQGILLGPKFIIVQFFPDIFNKAGPEQQ
jgi:hypothetical protein